MPERDFSDRLHPDVRAALERTRETLKGAGHEVKTVDIEGAEKFVVPQSAEFLAEYKPRMIIEGHAVNGVSTIDPLVTFLKGIGYKTRVEAQEGLKLQLIEASPD